MSLNLFAHPINASFEVVPEEFQMELIVTTIDIYIEN